ncbi:MAG: hypothetical protein ACTSU2_13435 [Promethearchaeota archaeon]
MFRKLFKHVGLYLIAFTLFLSFSPMILQGMAINASEEWCVSKDDEYYAIWTHHPLIEGKFPLATPESPLYEKVKVISIGPALAMHENPPTTHFEHSVNVSGYKWSGVSWDELSPGETTQLSIWNSSNHVWFCGALFSGAPSIAPKNYVQSDREHAIQVSADIIWLGTITKTINSSTNPSRVTFSNGTNSLTVAYEDNGFIVYYKLVSDDDVYECTIQTTEPELPGPSSKDVAGYSVIILASGLLMGVIYIFNKQNFKRT